MKEQAKDILLEVIRRRSEREAGRLAGEFVRAASEEKEAILAALQLERWLAENCCEPTSPMTPDKVITGQWSQLLHR